MEAVGSKFGEEIIDESPGKELTREYLPKSLRYKTGQWSKHPVSHWQRESTFGALIHGRRKKIAARFDEQAFRSGEPFLFRGR